MPFPVVTFSFNVRDVPPLDVTRVLGVEPSDAGELRGTVAGRTGPRWYWRLLAHKDDCAELDDGMRLLLDKIEPLAEGVRRLVDVFPSAQIGIGVSYTIEDDAPAVFLAPPTMVRLCAIARLGAALSIDIIDYRD